jgi:hypothetical protein
VAAAAEEAGNLERFLTSTTPSVTAQYLPKVFSGLLFAASVVCCVAVLLLWLIGRGSGG